MKMFLLFLFLVVARAVEVPCTYTDSDGNFYDLSPLSMCGLEGYTVSPPSDGPFVINVCNSVSQCGGGTAVCQMNTYNAGVPINATFAPYQGGKGVTVTYGNGDADGCPNNSPRSSVLNFICDPSASTPTFNFTGEKPQCTYNFDVVTQYACPTTKTATQRVTCPVYVYLVPHTHDDVGWLDTIDQYYEQEVKNILDTVVQSLIENPDRKFIYVEQAYFWRWWTDTNTNNSQRDNLRTLIKNGQWEFVIGGWVMQDEACTTFGADIDQLTLGHQFLFNTFGSIPIRGWQIDPFGQSTVTPTLEKLAGFKSHLIDRVTNKPAYQQAKTLQFDWYGSPSLGEEGMIFTEIMDGQINAYCDWYFTFDFDKQSVDSSNVANWAQKFYQMVDSRTNDLLTNVMLAAWGCDFQFQDATPMFKSMDMLIDYLQSQEKNAFVYVKYATLSEYYDALQAVPNVAWPTREAEDFFPLYEGLYWTGYFSSRVTLKGLTRVGEAAAHVVEPLYSVANAMALKSFNAGQAYNNIFALRLANADAQHHDGVTGTSVPAVVQMYETDLTNGVTGASQTTAAILSSYISKGQDSDALTFSSLLTIQSGQTIPVVIYNSLGWPRNDFVVLPTNFQSLSVVNSNNSVVPSQVNPNKNPGISGAFNLFFQVEVPAFGFQTYFVIAGNSQNANQGKSYELKLGADKTYSNGILSLTISGSTGRIGAVNNTKSGVNVDVDQNIFEYTSQHSGAYAFGPAGPANPVIDSAPSTTVVDGDIITEIYQEFNTYAQQSIRLYKSSNPDASSFVELQFTLGVLPSHIEVVTRFTSSVQNQQSFYTDDNGFEFLNREYVSTNPIESNFYPTIYASYIKDDSAQLTVISERSHGASSLGEGQLELMVHRNPDMSDGFGPGLTDTDVVYPVTRLHVDSPSSATLEVRRQPYLLNFPLTCFTASPTSSVTEWTSQFISTSSFISAQLPLNVHLLSLNALNSNTTETIFRLTHMFAVGEDPVLSQGASVDVAALFSPLKFKSFIEVSLTANQVLVNPAPTTVQLTCKQIRTFIIQFS